MITTLPPQEKIVALVVINECGELLLNKNSNRTLTNLHTWQVPYLIKNNDKESMISAAKNYLSALKIDSEIKQIFSLCTATCHKKKALNQVSTVLIATTKKAKTDFYIKQGVFRSVHLSDVLKEAYDEPSLYAPWLHQTLEGIALYISKNTNIKHLA